MAMGVAVVMAVIVGIRLIHEKVLYYNITSVHRSAGFTARRSPWKAPLPETGNGSQTAARNQTNRAGMKGISNSAQAMA